MKITNCLMNHLENPLGFAMDAPVFSYQVEDAAGKHQAAARIRISADAQGQQVLADTGFAPLNSLGERIALPLRPCTRYWWTAAVRTDAGEEAASEPHWFETGKREQAWQGQWISCAPEEKRHPIFHKTFAADGEIRQARLYICGLGLYEASINGQAVTQAKLTPGLQDYASWVQVQTYDVTKLLQAENEISVLMGRGWYLGRFTVDQGKVDVPYHGTRWKLIAELQLRYADGREEVIGTDDSWQVTRSNIVFSDIYDGEQVDDTLPDLPEENAVLLHEALPLEDQRSIPVLPQEEMTRPLEKKCLTLGRTSPEDSGSPCMNRAAHASAFKRGRCCKRAISTATICAAQSRSMCTFRMANRMCCRRSSPTTAIGMQR